MIREQIPWYVAGPVMGLCVVACRGLFNWRLGVTGGFTELIERLRRGRGDLDVRGWFLLGVVLGGTVYLAVSGGQLFHGYGWMTETFHGLWGGVAIGALLLGAGVLIGYGAKTAGGCTSGNGLSGVSLISPAALVGTATFFATAIAVSFAIEALT